MTKRVMVFVALAILLAGAGVTIFFLKFDSHRKITFAACEAEGGEAWRVDIYDPAICPACADYVACMRANEGASDLGKTCPPSDACVQCLEDNHPYPDRCPGGKKKLGEISDAAMWFMCCK